MSTTHSHHFKFFDKFNFIEAFIELAKEPTEKKTKKKEAMIIANALEETQKNLQQQLSTKEDLKDLRHELKSEMKDLKNELKDEMKDIKNELERLEYRLTARLTVIMATLFTLLPAATEFFKKLFN